MPRSESGITVKKHIQGKVDYVAGGDVRPHLLGCKEEIFLELFVGCVKDLCIDFDVIEAVDLKNCLVVYGLFLCVCICD